MPSDNPLLSIIILSYNTKDITENCLNSILNSAISFPYEIIIIDNNSSDNSPQMLSTYTKKHSHIRFIKNTENTGFSKGNNQGAEAASGTYLLFLNSDTIILDNAIEKLVSLLQQSPDNVKFAGPKLLNADKTPQSSAGPFYSLPYMFAWQFLRGDHWGITRSSPASDTFADWVSGACLLTTKSVFNELGGFDEKIFMYMEEVDLLYRGSQKGYRTMFFAEPAIIHLGSASSGKTYPVLQVFNGSKYFYQKHYPLWQQRVLQYMLQLKAGIALCIGYATNNTYLKETYAKAYRIACKN